MERSLASAALFPTKMDAGIKVSGAAAFLRYAVAVTNGEPSTPTGSAGRIRPGHHGTFRAAAPITKTVDLTAGTSFATKGFHPGTPATKGSLKWQDQNEDGTAQAGEVTGLPGFAGSPAKNFNRWAFGLDLGVRLRTSLGDTRVYGEVYASQNYDRGFLISDPLSTTEGGVATFASWAAMRR
jgi:hypothetical protein